jgi:hypothetical protein
MKLQLFRREKAAKMTNVEKPERRILVLGSTPHTRSVKAYEWDNLPKDLNVADYDVVIMDFGPFMNKDFAAGLNLDLIPKQNAFGRLLFSTGSEVIAVGSPDFRIGSNPYLFSHWWMPAQPRFTFENGEAIKEVDDGYKEYFSNIKSWSYYLDGFEEIPPLFYSNYLQAVPGANYIQIAYKSLAQTRFGRAIAFYCRFKALKVTDQLPLYERSHVTRQELNESGNVIWLPQPTEISTYEAIDLLLRQRYGLLFETQAPEWVAGFELPAEKPYIEAIQDKRSQINQLTAEIGSIEKSLGCVSRYRKLLYEQGQDALEPVVRDALRELGAEVQDPQTKGREDGRLIDPQGRQAILEIKGRAGTLRAQDLRELDNWVRDAIAYDDWAGKGILVANLQCDLAPKERKNTIPANCVQLSRNYNISILSTTQIFHALAEYQGGKLNLNEFWNQILTANGPCILPDLT